MTSIYHTPGQQGIRAAKAEATKPEALPDPKRLREALRTLRSALENYPHWQPSMAQRFSQS